MDIALAVSVPVALMFAGHFFPWRRLLGAPLPRPLAYLYGVGVILGTATFIILAEQPDYMGALRYLWIVAASAGAATLAAYGIDAALEAKHLRADIQDRKAYLGDVRTTD